MSYDDWKTDVGDWPSVEDPPCPDCGAAPDEDCAPDCACPHCLVRRERQAPDAA